VLDVRGGSKVKTLRTGGVVLALLPLLIACGERVPKGNRTELVRQENFRLGLRTWKLKHPAESGEVEAYALRQSVFQGETLDLAISVSSGPAMVHWEAFRLGYYDGANARAIAAADVVASTQSPCPISADGLVACSWTPTAHILITPDFAPGVYVFRLTREDGWDAYVPFIVRSRVMRPDILVTLPTTTWAAYNAWGGASLYEVRPGAVVSRPAWRVSFDRPYAHGHGAATLLETEFWALVWLEAQQLEVAYVGIEDLDREPELLSNANAVVVAGHDEYWTHSVRRRLDTAVRTDVSLLVLSANVGYWQIRLEPSSDGRDRRVVTCFKGDAPKHDPVGKDSPELTVRFRDSPVRLPERWLFGEQYEDRFGYLDMPLVVKDTSAWPFQGTGFHPGDTVGRGVGYEIDTVGGEIGREQTVLGDSPFLSLINGAGRAQMSLHPVPGGWVFAAGSADFSRLLADPEVADARVRRLVSNVLYDSIERSVPAESSPLPNVASIESRTVYRAAHEVAVFAGSPGELGDRLGPRLEARLRMPLAVVVARDGTVYVGDVGTGRVLALPRQSDARVLKELARAKVPQALAIGPLAELYVADGRSGDILRRTGDGKVAKLAWLPLARGLAASADGKTLYVSDPLGGTVQAVDLKDPMHPMRPVLDGLVHPSALALGADGALYIQEAGSRILRWQSSELVVMAGKGRQGLQDGPALEARFIAQDGLAVLPDGSLAISDPGNYRVRRLADGEVTTFAGTGRVGTKGGPGDRADLVMPAGLAVGPDGRLYVAETGNGAIRVITP